MRKRRPARECALQILFQLEFNASDPEAVIRDYWANHRTAEEIRDLKKIAASKKTGASEKTEALKKIETLEQIREYGTWLVRGIREAQENVDAAIQAASEHWRIARMAVVDRNILRIAVYEMLEEKTLVPAIIINEAIEIAKTYSGEQASVFINGILDAVRRKLDPKGSHGREKRGPGA